MVDYDVSTFVRLPDFGFGALAGNVVAPYGGTFPEVDYDASHFADADIELSGKSVVGLGLASISFSVTISNYAPSYSYEIAFQFGEKTISAEITPTGTVYELVCGFPDTLSAISMTRTG
jgi:hypothetical protein